MITETARRSPAAPDEELAGPFVPPSPTRAGERVSAIDVLRGFSLLGILVMNIDSFGTAEGTHDIPIDTPVPSFSGPHAHLNLAVLLLKWCFFESKMRGLFSLLFGAGVILLTSRAEERGAAATMADTFTRRNLLLMLFGLLHGVFIWHGDILFDYGLCALLFLYPARKLPAKALIWMGLAASLILSTLSVVTLSHAAEDLSTAHRHAEISRTADPAGLVAAADAKQWSAFVAAHPKKAAARSAGEVEEAHAGYLAMVKENLDGYFGPGLVMRVMTVAGVLPLMLTGMGLCKLGFLSARSSDRVYALTAVLGFGISLPVYVYGLLHAYAQGFYFLTLDKWVWLPYTLTSDAGMLAIAASVMLLIKHGFFRALQRGLAAVGRTAFSNYIGTSLLCQFLFLWGPWKLYGKLEYYQLLYVAVGVWVVNGIASTLWLRFFEYGPLEWLWRSLTYGKRQPLRLDAMAAG